MRRHIPGLHQANGNDNDLPDGLYLLAIERVFYRWHPQKPFYSVRFTIQEPLDFAGGCLTGRLYCTPKALWKLNWFLRDFGYDAELLGQDQIEESALKGLAGIAKVSHTTINGRCFLNLEGFAPAGRWGELSSAAVGREAEGVNDF